MTLCWYPEVISLQGIFASITMAKRMGDMLRRAELKRGLMGTQSRSFWAAQVPGWEGVGGL